MTPTLIWTVAILTGLGLLLALALYLVARRFKVEEDPRIDQVEAVLPGANCGGCGNAGCRAFAAAVVSSPSLEGNFCPVGGNEVMKKVAAVMGFEAVEKAPMVAVVRCRGTYQNRPSTSEYDGAQSCRVKISLYSTDTGCAYGCLRCGDCARACQFGALSLNQQTGLPEVNEAKCTACGACVKVCPKTLIELRNKGPRGMREAVLCMNKEQGPVAKKACSAACIGCGICLRTCAHGAIVFGKNLSYIDYTKCKLCRECEALCPSGAIQSFNFPKPLDKAAAKARALDRQRKAREAAAAAKAREEAEQAQAIKEES